MKATARSLVLGSILVSAIGFSACSSDDPEEEGVTTGGTGTGGKATGGGTAKGGAATGGSTAAKGGTTGVGGAAGGTTGKGGAGGSAAGNTGKGGAGGAGVGGAAAGTAGAGAPGVGGAGGAPEAGAPGSGGDSAGAAGQTTTTGGTTGTAGADAGGTAGADAGGTAGADAGGTAGAAGSGNTSNLLIVNGDMEASALAPWTGNGATAAYDTTAPHGGVNALKITGRSQQYHGAAQSLLPAVTAGNLLSGDIIYVSAWVKVSTASSAVAISLDTTDGTGTTYATGASYTVNDTTWVKVSQLLTLTWDTTPTVLNLYFKTPAETGTFSDMLVDDVTVVKVANVVANGGFESGTTGWTGNGGVLSAQTTVVRSGTASALVTTRTATYMGPAQNILSSVSSGAKVAMSAWVRVDMVTPAAVTISANFDLSGTGADATNIYPEIVHSDLTIAQIGTWVKLQTTWLDTVLPTWTVAPQAKLYVQVSDATADLYVDDVSFGVEPL